MILVLQVGQIPANLRSSTAFSNNTKIGNNTIRTSNYTVNKTKSFYSKLCTYKTIFPKPKFIDVARNLYHVHIGST